jgi:hypothetical protein
LFPSLSLLVLGVVVVLGTRWRWANFLVVVAFFNKWRRVVFILTFVDGGRFILFLGRIELIVLSSEGEWRTSHYLILSKVTELSRSSRMLARESNVKFSMRKFTAQGGHFLPRPS